MKEIPHEVAVQYAVKASLGDDNLLCRDEDGNEIQLLGYCPFSEFPFKIRYTGSGIENETRTLYAWLETQGIPKKAGPLPIDYLLESMMKNFNNIEEY